ncbi:FliM/FliN family flagellar motor switch protein [Candidatus Uabimicrobium amorphum]|uniref:Flagellar motor switch protein FliM n=1 Tax=Uabimicrobium amorphum TaxID=2596890 RepID=A0A5S9F3T9_UABAM|nr:FliM/FliN family flagellar motor switch protein [Candidatus Uabimicrobium amorphum]BBM85026.1 flagellar motor switch protein FliM [Candidatus Uabimicrobium amorphum]
MDANHMDASRVERYIPDSAQLSRQYLDLLHQIGDLCAQKIQMFIKQYLHMEVEIEWKGVSTPSYKEFITGLPPHCSIQILKEPTFQNFSLLVHNTFTMSAIIERLLGADDASSTQEVKFTSIEIGLVARLNTLILAEIQKSLKDIGELSWVVRKHETNPLLVSILSDKNDVLILAFKIGGALPEGEILLCISAMDAITYLEKSKVNKKIENRVINQELQQHLQKVPMRVSVRIGNAHLTYDELINLSPGDVIKLDRPPNYSALLHVEDTPKFTGKIGNYKHRWVFLIDKEGDQYDNT